LKKIDFPSNLSSIDGYAFNSCTSLKEINLPDSLISIGDYAFNSCTSLKQINLPNSLSSIGEYAFYYCVSLEKINLPSSLDTIGKNILGLCHNLTVFVDSNAKLNEDSINNCYYIVAEDNEYYSSYNGALYSKDFKILYSYPFLMGSGFKEIELHPNVELIKNGAFYAMCSNLSILFPKNMPQCESNFINSRGNQLDIYYYGSKEDLNNSNFGAFNYDYGNIKNWFYYSGDQPTSNLNNYWHFISNKPVLRNKSPLYKFEESAIYGIYPLSTKLELIDGNLYFSINGEYIGNSTKEVFYSYFAIDLENYNQLNKYIMDENGNTKKFKALPELSSINNDLWTFEAKILLDDNNLTETKSNMRMPHGMFFTYQQSWTTYDDFIDVEADTETSFINNGYKYELIQNEDTWRMGCIKITKVEE